MAKKAGGAPYAAAGELLSTGIGGEGPGAWYDAGEELEEEDDEDSDCAKNGCGANEEYDNEPGNSWENGEGPGGGGKDEGSEDKSGLGTVGRSAEEPRFVPR